MEWELNLDLKISTLYRVKLFHLSIMLREHLNQMILLPAWFSKKKMENKSDWKSNFSIQELTVKTWQHRT